MDKHKNALHTWTDKFQATIKCLHLKYYKIHQALNMHYLALKLILQSFVSYRKIIYSTKHIAPETMHNWTIYSPEQTGQQVAC